MNIKKTTTSPYHPQTNAQTEVCNKTIAQYLGIHVDKSTLDWELYMAPIKLMPLASAKRIDVVESNLKSESERRILVDSDSNDLIESSRSIFDTNQSIFD